MCRLEELTDCALILANRLAFEHSHSADAIALDVRDARGTEAVERSGAKGRAMCEPFAAENRALTRCERDAVIARMLGFSEATSLAIRALDEHWDGAGVGPRERW